MGLWWGLVEDDCGGAREMIVVGNADCCGCVVARILVVMAVYVGLNGGGAVGGRGAVGGCGQRCGWARRTTLGRRPSLQFPGGTLPRPRFLSLTPFSVAGSCNSLLGRAAAPSTIILFFIHIYIPGPATLALVPHAC